MGALIGFLFIGWIINIIYCIITDDWNNRIF